MNDGNAMLMLNDIFGQEQAIAGIRASWAQQRLPHGMIFSGPAGVGKGTTAGALATLFLCHAPTSDRPCGACPSCRIFPSGNHPDYHVIYRQLARLINPTLKARDITVNVIRDYVLGPAGLTPQMDHGRVFLIEEAELMNANAQSALLKTLEEPRGRTLIILLAESADLLLSTIRSRAQTVRFLPLDDELIRAKLSETGMTARDAADAARFAGGSLGLAHRWLADGIIQHALELEKLLHQGAGSLSGLGPVLKSAGEAYADRQIARDKLASRDQMNRDGISIMLGIGAAVFSRMLKNDNETDDDERICAAIEAFGESGALLDANVNVSLIFQHLAVTLDLLFSPAGVAD